jgi:hypothetical protein
LCTLGKSYYLNMARFSSHHPNSHILQSGEFSR